jgi:hypothetical protein
MIHRQCFRWWLVSLVVFGGAAGAFGGCTSAGKQVCRPGHPTNGCVVEVGGVTLVTTCGAADAFGNQECEVVSEEGTLDALCGTAGTVSRCTLGGDARMTTGVTQGSTAILLDQGGGTFNVSIPDLTARNVALSSVPAIQILAAAQGDGPAELIVTQSPCPCPAPATVLVGNDLAWIQVAEVSQAGGMLTLSGAGIEIDDLRIEGTPEQFGNSSHGCGAPGVFAPE